MRILQSTESSDRSAMSTKKEKCQKCRLLDYRLLWFCHFWLNPSIETFFFFFVMNFALWSQNRVSDKTMSPKLVALPPAQANRYSIMWQQACHIFVPNFAHLKFYSAAWQVVCETGNLTKMKTDNSSQREAEFSHWLTDGGDLPHSLWMRSRMFSRGAKGRACAVTCWGHVVHQFDLHARHVSASMLTWFCPCCDTPAPALTITFAYSVLHR